MIIFNFKFRDMKKQVLMMAALALALGGCSKTETTDVAQGRAIGFDTFVGKSTKAVTEMDNNSLTKFYVFGSYGSTGSWTPVFTNVGVSGGTVGTGGTGGTEWTPEQTAYWKPSTMYRFGAYSDGNSSFAGADFAEDTQTLTFTDYAVGNNDLIAAIPEAKETDATVTDEGAVELTFSHLLSQVKFTFKNEDSHDYIMEISNIKIENAVKTATGTLVKGQIASWNGTADGTYDFETLSDIAQAEGEGTHSTDLLVIPQSNETLVVSFTATFSDKTGQLVQGDFTAPLAYSGDAAGTKVNEWTPGFKYNYVATINGSTIDPELEQQVIKFKVESVTPWDDATEQNPDVTLEGA